MLRSARPRSGAAKVTNAGRDRMATEYSTDHDKAVPIGIALLFLCHPQEDISYVTNRNYPATLGSQVAG